MHIRPGFEVYWRRSGESQVGVDPRCALLLTDLQETEQRLLDRMPDAISAEELRWRGRELGLDEERISALLNRLVRAGYLVDGDGATRSQRGVGPGLGPAHDGPAGKGTSGKGTSGEGTSDEHAQRGRTASTSSAVPATVQPLDATTTYWHRAAVAGQHRLTDRAEAVVHVCGLGELGLRLACILAQSGVGTVSLRDRRRVRGVDVGGGLFRPSDVGSVREETALAVLRSIQPMVNTRMPRGTRPDLVVLVDSGVMDPIGARALMREDVPHLPVLVRELDTLIGPMVRPGLGVCLRCLDLHRCEKDPRWPAIATQVASRPPQGVETSLAWLAASFAAHQVLAAVDGRPTVLESTSAEISGWDPVPMLRRWRPHPECGCSPTTFEPGSLGATTTGAPARLGAAERTAQTPTPGDLSASQRIGVPGPASGG